jgi:hypothetical protein
MPDDPPLQAFVHMATRQNTTSNWTDIDNDLTNNNPDAYFDRRKIHCKRRKSTAYHRN